jgi:hypothetical protein
MRIWDDNINLNFREIGYDFADWINPAEDRAQWSALVSVVNIVINIRDPQKAENFLTS